MKKEENKQEIGKILGKIGEVENQRTTEAEMWNWTENTGSTQLVREYQRKWEAELKVLEDLKEKHVNIKLQKGWGKIDRCLWWGKPDLPQG